MPTISIVVPLYNESDNLQLLYDRLNRVMARMEVSYEYVWVNDGSRDDTMSVVRRLAQGDSQLKYLELSRNFGHQIAVTAGLEHSTGDCIVIIDADLQDPPELIVDLYAKMRQGYDVVYAKRRSREGESWFKKFTARTFYRILKRITQVDIPVDTGDYRIITRKVVEVLKQMPEYHRFLRGQIAWVGFKQTYVEYHREERHAGQTGYTYRKMLHFAIDGITAFSDFPLKLATIMGFFVSGIAFVTLLYALYMRLVVGDFVPGWTSIIVSVLFLGGVQLISIGIIGEYISRIHTQVKNRPLYVLKSDNIYPTKTG